MSKGQEDRHEMNGTNRNLERMSGMDFDMVCATWIKEDDEKVLEVLKKSDSWLSAEDLSKITGVPLFRVKRTLRLLNQQIRFAKHRKEFFNVNFRNN